MEVGKCGWIYRNGNEDWLCSVLVFEGMVKGVTCLEIFFFFEMVNIICMEKTRSTYFPLPCGLDSVCLA